MNKVGIFKAALNFAPRIIEIFFILILITILNFLTDLLKKKFEKSIARKLNEKFRRKPQTLLNVISGSLKFLIVLLGTLLILSRLNINVWPLLAGAGLAGFGISLAARDIISDFISGFFILLEDQYRLGDKIKIADREGEVIDITLRRTIIKDDEGYFHSIPNSQIKIVSKKS